MDVLKSYAHQVVSYHPEKFRDEMFEELYNELCEEFADWQLDHPDANQAAFLDAEKEHPMRFATRLAPDGSAYLIGPQFYYSFISALKVAVVVTVGFHLFLGVISALGSGNYVGSITRMMISVPATLMWVCISILGVFIALEKSGERATWLDNWKASKLVPIESHQLISKGETFFDLGVALIGLLWLVDIVQIPSLVRHNGSWVSGWVANLPNAFWVTAGILLVLDILYCIFRLVRNFWSPKLRLTSIVFNIAWMALLSYAASQSELISLGSAGAAGMEDLQVVINNVVSGSLFVVVAILALDTLNHGWRLYKPSHKKMGSKAVSKGMH